MINQKLTLVEYDRETAAAQIGPARDGKSEPPASPILERLLDLELPVSIAVGHAEVALKDVLQMKSGSVVQLDKESGEEVDLLVHGTLVARGEIVLVGQNYGIRINQILNSRPQTVLRTEEPRVRRS